MQVGQRFKILSLMQAALGAVIAAIAGLSLKLNPTSPADAGLVVSIAGLGAAGALYFLSIHQYLKKQHMVLSASIISGIMGLTIILVVSATGGLDSPYYALWLLGIVIAGLFGAISTVITVAATMLFYGYEIIRHSNQPGFMASHLGQLAVSLATAGVAEWIHLALGRSALQHEKVAQLSGKLDVEELKSNLLMQSVGDGVVVIDPDRRIRLFNPAAVRMTGWDEGSAQSIDYRLVLNLHDAKGNKITDETDPFVNVWKDGKNMVRNDLVMVTKGGHQVSVSLSLSPIFDANRQVTGGIALFRDISEDKEMERQRNEFISTASHEMRTPVAAIEGYLSLAMNPAVATVDARAKSYLDKAHSSTQHLGELFRDLLSITKLEDSKKLGEPQVFDLTELVKTTVEDMQFSAEKKSLEIQFGAADQTVRSQKSVLPVYAVSANPQRIREVVMNLIENAIKFTPEGAIHVSIGGNNDTVTVSVTDTGVGIPPEDISHLFQKFYRVDSTATRTIGGTGLGLYLCRTVIELFGGRIWVESKLNQGSSFKFSLPRLASDKIHKPATAPSQPAAAPAASTPNATPQNPVPPQPGTTKIPVTVATAPRPTLVDVKPVAVAK